MPVQHRQRPPRPSDITNALRLRLQTSFPPGPASCGTALKVEKTEPSLPEFGIDLDT